MIKYKLMQSLDLVSLSTEDQTQYWIGLHNWLLGLGGGILFNDTLY